MDESFSIGEELNYINESLEQHARLIYVMLEQIASIKHPEDNPEMWVSTWVELKRMKEISFEIKAFEDRVRKMPFFPLNEIPTGDLMDLMLSQSQFESFLKDIQSLQQKHPLQFWITLLLAFRPDVERRLMMNLKTDHHAEENR